MGYAYSDIAFTSQVRDIQTQQGSREQYAFMDQMSERGDHLGGREQSFIEQADHFFQATTSASGWPYVQHRGGPAGFLKVIDNKTLGFADFVGNRQYLSVGNLKTDDRISLIVMDYANQRRLKILGRARTTEAVDAPELAAQLAVPGYQGRVERVFLIDVEGYDWNCPQHITPRFTEAEIGTMTGPLHAQIKRLKEQLAKTVKMDLPAELGAGPLRLKITGVRQLANNIRGFELRAVNGDDLPAVSAGAHLEVPVRLADGSLGTRTYSISSDSAQRKYYEIAVLRQADGRGGSVAAYDDFRFGMALNCALPVNDFYLDDSDAAAVFIAGGIGITPIRSMMHEVKRKNKTFALHYAVKSRQDAAFLEQLEAEFAGHISVYAADEGSRLDIEALLQQNGDGKQIYVCGPERLIDAVVNAASALSLPRKDVHFERFSAKAVATGKAPFFVTLKRSGVVVNVPTDSTILEAVEREGIKAAYSCRTGNCGMCAVKVLEGDPDHRDEALTPAQRNEDKLMCICISRSKGESLTLDL
jgi:ferredoxin-NADP reductase/predicted pyridoxine 5'-phosphate oxidase superfamily flavin-nucleotide-binding protein